MNPRLQSILFCLYRTILATGLLATPWGRWMFERAYLFYKHAFEAGDLSPLKDFAEPGSTVVDVGANIGFFATMFAGWTGSGGRVIAIEPEEINFARLQRAVAAAGAAATVETVNAVAAEQSGTLYLTLNPHHPGDHKIGQAGVAVAAFSLDDLLAERDWPAVSLIKIDVQGAEARVIAGAAEILRRFHPALFIEVDDACLRAMGSSAHALLSDLAGNGYGIHQLTKKGPSPSLTIDEALRILGPEGSYLDFLFVHTG